MRNIWILTRAINAYEQDGDYFVSAWNEKPTRSDLLKLFHGGDGDNPKYTAKQHKRVGHILNGGGREYPENEWYYLTELKPGTEYEPTES